MNIRPAKSQDTPQIIEVLKAGLGENAIKKTPEIWQYKHVENPFGESIVLVAEKYNRIAGVRAFMQWRWQKGRKIYKAYRAVDTATHPDFQRQGVFKKLTLQALDVAQNQSSSFIFNTPNDNSLPGYLKMDWQKVGKIKVALIPFLFPRSKKSINFKNNLETLEELCQIHNEKQIKTNKFFTPKSKDYLIWRYVNNPIIKYTIVTNSNYFIAFYPKKHKFFTELRIAEILFREKEHLKEIKKITHAFAGHYKCQIISTAEKDLFNLKIYTNFGPTLTFKPISNDKSLQSVALNIQNWNYSLGDLELF